MKYTCAICKGSFGSSDTYEYRGAYSCADHFDEMCKKREWQRQEIIQEESAKTDKFRGLDLTDSVIGKANREILKADLEIASKESSRLKEYEGRK